MFQLLIYWLIVSRVRSSKIILGHGREELCVYQFSVYEFVSFIALASSETSEDIGCDQSVLNIADLCILVLSPSKFCYLTTQMGVATLIKGCRFDLVCSYVSFYRSFEVE